MVEELNSGFLVDAYTSPVVVKIMGRASFINSAPLRDFFHRMIQSGKTEFLMDFQECTTMDSTFLGITAGVALELRKQTPPGKLVLCRLGERNLELVKNLGLHRILLLDEGNTAAKLSNGEALKGMPLSEQENAKMVLKAHETLCQCDDSNKERFQDVIHFLKNQIEEN